MKKLFSILFLFFSSITFCQPTESLKTATKNLYEANYLLTFETIVSLSYPEMVTTIGTDVMLEKLDKYYQNDDRRDQCDQPAARST